MRAEKTGCATFMKFVAFFGHVIPTINRLYAYLLSYVERIRENLLRVAA